MRAGASPRLCGGDERGHRPARSRHGGPSPASRQLRMRGDLGDVVDDTGGDVGTLERGGDYGTGRCTELVIDKPLERGTVREPLSVRGEPIVFGKQWRTEHVLAKSPPLAIRLDREHDAAVGTPSRHHTVRSCCAVARRASVSLRSPATRRAAGLTHSVRHSSIEM